MRLNRHGVRLLLIAAAAMVFETSCSHAPPPDVLAEARIHEGKGEVVRFHANDGITYVTSSYALTDSSVVIRNILRDTKYYAPTEAKLYDQTLTPAPEDLTLPAEVPLATITAMEKWEPRSVGQDMGVGLLVIVGVVVVALIAVLNLVEFYFGGN